MLNKSKSFWLVIVAVFGMTACASPPPKSDQAKIVGDSRVYFAVATESPDIKFVHELFLPPGNTKLIFRTELGTGGLIPALIADSYEQKKMRTCEIELKGGHEYRAEIEYKGWQAYWDRPIIITDATTGEQLARLVVPSAN